MRTHLQKHVSIHKFFGAILGAMLMFLIATPIIAVASKMYYTFADISNFYVNESFVPEDICFGDLEQRIQSVRYVGNNDSGYEATVVRELFRQEADGFYYKIYEEGAFTVNIEPRENGLSYRIQRYLYPLNVGAYRWQLSIKQLFLPADVVRTDVPIVTHKDPFYVIDCSENDNR